MERRLKIQCELTGLNHEYTTRCEKPEGSWQTLRNCPITAIEIRSLAYRHLDVH